MDETVTEATNAVTKNVKKLTKWPIVLAVFILVVVLSLPLILGELHGNIPDAVQNDSKTNQDGYKVTYGFDFIPSMFKFVGDSLILSYIAILGMIVLAVTPIASVITNYIIRSRELKNEVLPLELAHKKEIQEMQNNFESAKEDKRLQSAQKLKEIDHKNALEMEEFKQGLERQRAEHQWQEDARIRKHDAEMKKLDMERERHEHQHKEIVEEKKRQTAQIMAESQTKDAGD